jgi:hypothetical protein
MFPSRLEKDWFAARSDELAASHDDPPGRGCAPVTCEVRKLRAGMG